MQTVIIQRIVPHYRMPLFARLYSEFGWVVATDRPRGLDGLHVLNEQPEWLHHFAFKRSANHQYRAVVPLNDIINSLAPDAVLAEFTPQMTSTWRLAADAALGRAGGRKLVFWSQGSNVERGFRKPQDLLLQSLRLGLMAPADAHVCYSAEGAAYLRRWLPSKAPVFVAGNTVDMSLYEGRGVDTSQATAGITNLLFVGRLTHDKRVPMLIEALALARRVAPGLRLTIIGDGPEMPAVVAAAAGQEHAVKIVGPLYNDAALAPYFQAASLFVYAGSIGLAANHALAYGVPVVIFDKPLGARHHPEHRYVVDGVTGYRIASATVKAMAECLIAQAAAPVPAKAALQVELERYVASNMTLDAMVKGFRELHDYLAK